VEHTLFAEVEHALGRHLDEHESRRIEMPASTSVDDFDDWLRSRRRRDLAPLQDGSVLVGRIRDLQPYQRRDVDNHPLRVLAEHTNLAKHRTPGVAATLLAAVIPDVPGGDLRIANVEADHPIRAGHVLVSGPVDVRIPLAIWPKVSIKRPHTDTWHVLVKELSELEQWVRTVAVPYLITGTYELRPLPPHLDTSRGYIDIQSALSSAGETAAADRALKRIEVAVLRGESPRHFRCTATVATRMQSRHGYTRLMTIGSPRFSSG
jgi:hypothetical protein